MRERVETDELKESVLSLLEMLQYGKYDNIFKAWHHIQSGPLLQPDFDRNNFKMELTIFLFMEQNACLNDAPKQDSLGKHFDKPSGHFYNILKTTSASKS